MKQPSPSLDTRKPHLRRVPSSDLFVICKHDKKRRQSKDYQLTELGAGAIVLAAFSSDSTGTHGLGDDRMARNSLIIAGLKFELLLLCIATFVDILGDMFGAHGDRNVSVKDQENYMNVKSVEESWYKS